MPSGGELLVVIVVVFLLFGGRELPKMARTMGKWTAVMKRSLNDVRREFNRISIQEELKEASKSVKDMTNDPLGLKNLDPPQNPIKSATRRSEEDSAVRAVEPNAETGEEVQAEHAPMVTPSGGRVAQGNDQEKLNLGDTTEQNPSSDKPAE